MKLRHWYAAIAAVALAGCNLAKNPDSPSAPANTVNYAALGASDTIGYGGSQPCLPFVECTSGYGYVQQIAQRFMSAGKTVSLDNLGVPGAVLSPQVQAMGNALGLGIQRNLLDDEAGYVPKAATLVTVFIGANDVNTLESVLDAGQAGMSAQAFMQTQTQNFGQDLGTMLSKIRARSASTRIIALNLPNMGLLPFSAGRSLGDRQVLQQLSVGFSAQINALTSSGVLVIDLMCDSNFYNPSIFSSDGFHPNDAGYTYLTNLVYTAAVAGTAPAPQASCGWMTQL